MPKFRQDLSGAQGGTITGRGGGKQQLGAAAQRRAGRQAQTLELDNGQMISAQPGIEVNTATAPGQAAPAAPATKPAWQRLQEAGQQVPGTAAGNRAAAAALPPPVTSNVPAPGADATNLTTLPPDSGQNFAGTIQQLMASPTFQNAGAGGSPEEQMTYFKDPSAGGLQNAGGGVADLGGADALQAAVAANAAHAGDPGWSGSPQGGATNVASELPAELPGAGGPLTATTGGGLFAPGSTGVRDRLRQILARRGGAPGMTKPIIGARPAPAQPPRPTDGSSRLQIAGAGGQMAR